MKKEQANKLHKQIINIEKHFSNPDRERNYNQEIFKCSNILPLSDTVALVTFEKNTGKKTNMLFFYVKDYWVNFFPTDSHELGMWNYLHDIHRLKLETENYTKNFEGDNY